MLSFLNLKSIVTIVIFIWAFSVAYLLEKFFEMRTHYKILKKQHDVLIHRRQEWESTMVEVEKGVDKNLETQRRALDEIRDKGYLTPGDKRYYKWMRAYQNTHN